MCKPWSAPASYYSYYYYCKSTSINKKENNSGFNFTFSQIFNLPGWNDYNWVVSSNNLYDFRTINTRGRDVQLCSGSNSGEMFVTAFYPATSPYYFQMSNSMGSVGLSKSSGNSISENRGIVIENNGSGIFYSLANLTVDGKSINFLRIINTEDRIDTLKRINILKEKISRAKYSIDSIQCLLLSESFEIKENSKIYFNEFAGIGDSTSAIKLFGEKGNITVKLVLIDDASGEVIGTVKESIFDRFSSSESKISSNTLNLKGKKKREVKVKVMLSSNIGDLECSLINHYSDGKEINALSKDAVAEELTIETLNIPSEFVLEQNYPNPFNPTTTISYQLIANSYVSLKVYDILGREVVTLVDDVKEAGYYLATFDASHLSSGAYFVRLTASPRDGSKPYFSIKKMLLTK
jgi:hypothetical protein